MLGINVRINDNEVIVGPQESITSKNSKEVQDECLKVIDRADTFILDLENVEFISSAGLRVIVLLQQLQIENNRAFKIRKPNETVFEILDNVGFVSFLTII